MMGDVLGANDLPLPTNIPPWMGLAIILFWVGVVFTAVSLVRVRRAARAARGALVDHRSRRRRRANPQGRPLDRQLGPASDPERRSQELTFGETQTAKAPHQCGAFCISA